ncbi:hypothetical protein [Pseudomonas brassicacearum]|uniref:Uncharacterized protein n=1 Tax=Pseudomonas brassicacearum TaxID=930166 RepID=A0A423GNY9_9PSED|nr:hypothetical protein [Pseudomonas brassicacearum]ROM94371.1 hypothetical protein BK658_17585 [Pseudomonas brassicacearum]
MNRQEEFLAKALAVHHEYEKATVTVHKMMRESRAVGAELDAVVVRQIASLDAWMELPHEFGDFKADD